tara:strand:- start:98 stop:949 length:852 start_codon:yes stop_codon:yes gene_type:complete
MNIKDVYCNNCGIRGHLYKDCRKPVISCGNIIFRIDRGLPEILMIQRKDSLCYIEFLRGKYDIYNIEYIQILIDKCNIEEKGNIIGKPFHILWENLWLIKGDKNDTYKNSSDYLKGYEKFNKLLVGYYSKKYNKNVNLKYFIENSKTIYNETEWEFPKGRRNNNENNLECARREFMEETNYNIEDYELIENLKPFSEEFMGENKVRYKYIYYIGILKNIDKLPFIDYDNKDQYSEIKNILWLTKDKSLDIIRDYHHTRRDVIIKIFNFISMLYDDKLNKYSLI